LTDPELFVVRVWRELASGFRASVRRVDEEQTHHFSQPEEMARFLSGAIEPTSARDHGSDSVAPSDTSLSRAGSSATKRS